MVMERQLQQLSADRFIALVDSLEYADRIVVIVGGEIIEMSKPSGLHGRITFLLSLKVGNHVVDNRLGIVTAADTGFILERNPEVGDAVRGLDIAFLSRAKTPAVLPDKLVDVAPDLAVEVVSPSNMGTDMRFKIRQLLAAGTALIWMVYPETRALAPSRWKSATGSAASMSCLALNCPSARSSPPLKPASAPPAE